ncbi:serine/threonine-protein kinase [Diaminobutyricimonas sp. TR449]|uniref:serine/threonine-protein kinase n=1 Tax=Diaminobutyricimonas sp. TR449 TaxID=2708076 RepID=UPI001424814E|nr:serine/threonine-protein kinase [Diaminobutyricimonas sp. TR449]
MNTPSALVADRYRLVAMLGAGGMGVVWHAWDERLHRDVALKMLRTGPELTDTERQLATDRAMREARITAGLHHPHAVTVFDVVEHEGQPCIVMELIESTPLSTLLQEHGTLTPSETARVGAQVSSALAAAHKLRIVHRDVKPGNILITEDGSAMISDFGISHALGDASITATGMIHGTPAYLAPEVARGLPTSFASDVFSLGSTLYAMVEGDPPFGSDKNAIALLHKVARGGYPPPEHAGPLAPLLREMLSVPPKLRPSMASISQSLSALHDETRIAAAPAAVPVVPELLGEDPAPERTEDVATKPIERHPPTATVPLHDAEEASDPRPATPATTPVTDRTRPVPAVYGPTAATVPVDHATGYESPTAAATKPLAEPAARQPVTAEGGSGHVPPPKSVAAPEGPTRRRRRASVIAGILVLVAAAIALGAILLANPLRPSADDAAEPRTSNPTAPSVTETPDSEAAPPTAAPETPAPPEPSTPPTSAPPPTEAPEPGTPEQQAVETVAGYYAMLPGDLDSAWPLMTADYQENHAGGRGAYEAFWEDIADVEVADVRASAPNRARATLTYYFRDGRVVQEVTAYRLEDEGGALKIAATEVLSSTQLE